jgi:hypothetical protein
MEKFKDILKKVFIIVLLSFNALVFSIYGTLKLSGTQLGLKGSHHKEYIMKELLPVNFMWRCHAISRVYALSIGLSQILASLLILIPFTRKFGLLYYLYNVFQIVLINYCFELTIEVMLTSSLLLMNILILIYIYLPKYKPLILSKWNYFEDNPVKRKLIFSIIGLNALVFFIFGVSKLLALDLPLINERFHYNGELKVKDVAPVNIMWIFYTISRYYEVMIGLILLLVSLLTLIPNTHRLAILFFLFMSGQIVMINFFLDLSIVTKIISLIVFFNSCLLAKLNLPAYKALFSKN